MTRSKVCRVVFIVCATLVAALYASAVPARATYNYHVFWEYDNNFYNCFAYFRNNFLVDNYGSDPLSFTTPEQWRGDAGNGNWTETGLVAGDLNNSDWHGVFGAGYQAGSYFEFAIGPYNPSDYAIESILSVESSNSYIVDYLYDDHEYATINTSAAYSDNHQVGMESNSSSASFNYFYSGVDSSYWQVYAGGSSWYFWPTFVSNYYNDSPGGSVTSSYGYDSSSRPHGYWYW